MLKLYTHLQCLRADRRGITALEYGILAVIIVAAVAALSQNFTDLFSNVFSRVNSQVNADPPTT